MFVVILMADALTMEEIKSNKLTLEVIPSDIYTQTIEQAIKVALDSGKNCVLISLNRPADEINSLARKKKGKFYLVDGTSLFSRDGKEYKNIDKVFKVKNPSQMNELMYNSKKALEEAGSNALLLFDSLTTLLVYNDEKQVLQFSLRMAVFLRSKKISSVGFVVDQKLAEELINAISTVARIKRLEAK